MKILEPYGSILAFFETNENLILDPIWYDCVKLSTSFRIHNNLHAIHIYMIFMLN